MQENWFITGINSGIGRQLTEQLLKAGARVAGTIRQPASVDDLKAKYGESLDVFELDLTDAASIAPVVREVFQRLGRIDVVVNNAGYGLFGAAEGLTIHQIRHQIDTNLIGPILVSQAAIPHLRSQGSGRIIAISTYGGQATHPGASLYHASKWGMEGFFDSLRQELAAFGIGVTIVEPGGIQTAFRSTALSNVGADIESYQGTPVGMIRQILQDPARVPAGDPAKVAKAIIDSIDGPAPRRLVLGSDSYAMIHKALSERLAEVEDQKESASITDASKS